MQHHNVTTPKLKFKIPVLITLTLLRSLVNTPEASPYSVPLALFKTPSTSLQINKSQTLWDHRSWHLESSGHQSTLWLTTGAWHIRDECSRHSIRFSGPYVNPWLPMFMYSPIFKFRNNHNWAKWFLLRQKCVVFHISEYSRLKEVTCKDNKEDICTLFCTMNKIIKIYNIKKNVLNQNMIKFSLVVP